MTSRWMLSSEWKWRMWRIYVLSQSNCRVLGPANIHALLLCPVCQCLYVFVCNCFPNGSHPKKHWPHLSCQASMWFYEFMSSHRDRGLGIWNWDWYLQVVRKNSSLTRLHLMGYLIGNRIFLNYLWKLFTICKTIAYCWIQSSFILCSAVHF